MKLLYYSIAFSIAFFSSCSEKKDKVICHSVEKIISQYQKQNRASHGDLRMHLLFYNVLGEDHVQVVLDSNSNYDYIDGCFVFHGDTIMYGFITEMINNNLINESLPIPSNEQHMIPTESYSCEEPLVDDYIICSNEVAIPSNNMHPIQREEYIAKDTSGVVHNGINKALNQFINENYLGILYEIVIRKIKGQVYICFDTAESYDKRFAKYFFYRNHHLVVVYVLDGVDEHYFDSTTAFSDTILGYRSIEKKYWMYPRAELFRIDKNTLKDVGKIDSLRTFLLLDFNNFDF